MLEWWRGGEAHDERGSGTESGDGGLSDAVIESAGVGSGSETDGGESESESETDDERGSETDGKRYTHDATVSGNDLNGDDLVSGNDSGVQNALHRREKIARRRDVHCHHSAAGIAAGTAVAADTAGAAAAAADTVVAAATAASTSANDDHGHDLDPVRWQL